MIINHFCVPKMQGRERSAACPGPLSVKFGPLKQSLWNLKMGKLKSSSYTVRSYIHSPCKART